MSQSGGPSTVGRLDVVISATGAEATKAELQAVGTEGGKAADTIKGKFDEFGKALRSPLQSIQRITGAIAGAVAVATTFLTIGKQIGEVLVQWSESGQEYLTRVRETGDRKKEILKLDKEIQDVENTLSQQLGRERMAGDMLETRIRDSERLIKEKRALRDLLISEDQAQEKIAKITEKQKKIAKDAADLATERAKSTERDSYFAEDAAKADEDAANARLDRLDAEAKKNAELRKDEEERQAKFLAGLFDETKLIKQIIGLEEEKKRVREAEQQVLEQQREFIRSMRDEIRNALPAEKIVSDLGRIVAQLERIAQQRGR